MLDSWSQTLSRPRTGVSGNISRDLGTRVWGLHNGLSLTNTGHQTPQLTDTDLGTQALGAGLWTLIDKLWGLGYRLSLTSCGGWAMDSD